jgi:tryptophan 2,3-dioxygenase
MPPNYWDYLKLDQLLTLQGGLEREEDLVPDELHFIVVHQVYELWFKLMLAELRLARDHLAAPQVPEERIPYVVHHLKRVNRILDLALSQWKVMETLTPQDFLGFRDKLIPASGFQSFQMREIEILLGLSSEQRITYGKVHPLDHIRKLAAGSPGGAMAVARIEQVSAEQSLRSALHEWLFRTPIDGSRPGEEGDEAAVGRFIDAYLEAQRGYQRDQWERFQKVPETDPEQVEARLVESAAQARAFLTAADTPEPQRRRIRRIRAGLLFIESYRSLPLLAWPRTLIDAVVELEEQLVLMRTRHARMVERMIGRRVGTGGSSGVDYLDKTTSYRVFTELWAVRTLLLPRRALPPLAHRDFYGFATR